MSFPFFENMIDNDIIKQPNDMYRDLMQAFIDSQWDNTSAKTPENGGEIKEQYIIGSSVFNSVEAWVAPVTTDIVSGRRDARDFLKLIFKNIDHESLVGLFYTYDSNYWIVHTYNHFNGLPQDIGIRRCNNILKIIDPENGSTFSIPCVVDYESTSENPQIVKQIITPNNHLLVITQGNSDTLRLFKTNKRFIIGGRVFKIIAFQNALYNELTSTSTTILYINLALDEVHDKDNFTTEVAHNGDYDYEVNIDSNDATLTKNATGKLEASVKLNGGEVSKTIVWSTSNKDIVTIDSNGNYSVVGEIGQTATITAKLSGNENVSDSIVIIIANESQIIPKIFIEPSFDKIRQYQSISFEVKVEYNGSTISPTSSSVIVNTNYVSIIKNGNSYTLTCDKISSDNLTLNIQADNTNPAISTTDSISYKTVSMMG